MRPSVKRRIAIAATITAVLAGCGGASDEGDVRNIGEEDGSGSGSASSSSTDDASGSASSTDDASSSD